MLIIRDDFSRFLWLYGLKSKSSSATAFAFREFLAEVRADANLARSRECGQIVGESYLVESPRLFAMSR